jgi:hypothetical protein
MRSNAFFFGKVRANRILRVHHSSWIDVAGWHLLDEATRGGLVLLSEVRGDCVANHVRFPHTEFFALLSRV